MLAMVPFRRMVIIRSETGWAARRDCLARLESRKPTPSRSTPSLLPDAMMSFILSIPVEGR